MIVPSPRRSTFEEERPKPRLRLVVASPPDIDERILSDVFVPSRRSWRGFVGSLALHALALLLVPSVGVFTDWLDLNQNQLRLRVTSRHPLNIWVPERLYFTRDTAPAGQPRLPVLSRRAAPKPANPELQRTQTAEARPAANPPRKFELPVSPVKPKAEPLVLQPPSQIAELAAPQRLPQVMFWARQMPGPPTPKALVLPGRREAPTPPPALIAPPVLEIPNREPSVSDLNVARAVPTVPRPALVLPPPSATIPVRILAPPGPLRSGSLDLAAGDPMNLIVLSANPLPAGRVMTVPSGNQTGGFPAPSPGAGTGTADKTKLASGTANDAGASQGGGTSSRGSDTGFGEPREEGQLQARASLPARLPIRMIHPANGVFDLVIIQSSLAESFPETAGMLSGRPIYSVYLKIGAGKDWILQYCEPNSRANFQRDKDIVNLAGAASIKAPYPRVILAPDIELLASTGYTLIHGMLKADGRLRDLTLKTGPSDSPMKVILPLLEEWEFRPATKDNKPVEVEVLFAIPPSMQF